ncbi:MAG: selenocysteine-specific translation factor, partial [Deltaproteobacteria bacterium]|nr:selenocysteine-specific translation factor [Deltaproteobacteria bacterium]
KSKFPSVVGSKLFNQMVTQMIKSKQIVQEEDTVRLAGHKVSLGVDQTNVREKILGLYHKKRLMPPYFKNLEASIGIKPAPAKDVLMLLVDEGLIVKVKEDLYFDAEERISILTPKP